MNYEKYTGNNVLVEITNQNKDDSYTKIGDKAFLSCKNVSEIKLPDTILEIGDWAFAHMKELKRLIVPSKPISIGRDAFLDCSNLTEIICYPDNSNNEGMPYLLASCVTILNAYKLFNPEAALDVGANEVWCEKYDDELVKFINKPDDSNFQSYIVGWFDDEGEEEQLRKHIESTRINKLKLCMLRLKYKAYIKDDVFERLISYIKKQFEDVSYEKNNSSWVYFRDNLSDDIDYIRIVAENKLLTEELKSELITCINKRNGNPEVVAFLLSAGGITNINQLFEL
ncbi:MAG: leucine-rich repeat domain-containing protein [Lachnospiraceae bacterium]|nr:leucine-rich repeat domain-containing protein [Lachnospiraceae bacterium]